MSKEKDQNVQQEQPIPITKIPLPKTKPQKYDVVQKIEHENQKEQEK